MWLRFTSLIDTSKTAGAVISRRHRQGAGAGKIRFDLGLPFPLFCHHRAFPPGATRDAKGAADRMYEGATVPVESCEGGMRADSSREVRRWDAGVGVMGARRDEEWAPP
jgi:hypothetical protein